MATARSTCLSCCHAEAADRPPEPMLEVCTTCQGPLQLPYTLVSSNGAMSVSRTLFNRLRVPRQLTLARALVPNITREQFATWMSDSWELVKSTRTAKEDTEEYLLIEWEDVKRLCNFEVVARATQDPSQGRGNIRFSSRGTMGVIVPPILVKHT